MPAQAKTTGGGVAAAAAAALQTTVPYVAAPRKMLPDGSAHLHVVSHRRRVLAVWRHMDRAEVRAGPMSLL